MTQLLAHLWGDYILQSDWMATNKTRAFLPAAIHALLYSATFLLFRPNPFAWATICLTHFFIDRYRLARYVVWKRRRAPIVSAGIHWSVGTQVPRIKLLRPHPVLRPATAPQPVIRRIALHGWPYGC